MPSPRIIGRYALYGEIAAGGMATVHLGRLVGAGGVHRLVAIKQLHPQFARDPEFVRMFLDEARLASRIHHPNVVSVLDLVSLGDELFLIMEYVQGEALSSLARVCREREEPIATKIVASIMIGALQGLHAAHIATNERGESLSIVHRDVSPHNILISVDGVARVLDFGVAKAAGRLQTTREGSLKGKLPYMPPEQLRSEPVDCRADIYAAGVVLWELLTGRRLFDADNEGALLTQIMLAEIEAPSTVFPALSPDWDPVVMKALSPNPKDRFQTADEMAEAIEALGQTASGRMVGQWVSGVLGDSLAKRARAVRAIEEADAFADIDTTAAGGIVSMLPPAGDVEKADPPVRAPSLPSDLTASSAVMGRSRWTRMRTIQLGGALFVMVAATGWFLEHH